MRNEIQIGESTFFVQKFSAMEQLRIFGDLQKTLIPSLAKLFSNAPPQSKTEKTVEKKVENTDGFAEGLEQLSRELDGSSLIKLAEMLIKPELVAVQRDDLNNGNDMKLTRPKFDEVFADMSEIVELVIFILRLNFESFFTKYLARLGALLKSNQEQ
ncbi:hypothetical protein NSA18_12055 [Pasteurella caecimuris]|uniref:phage tail assembly chaperone n=1 Tax=Rodentibacter caecimuris TaxID=1796644 RepID=UPI0021500A53|nr:MULTISPECIES: hypothetical protein [Pasteurellaceae]MCR1838608.1 hypothetical protein [Pasteurella caecimuris]MCU0107905.1 hypothetical protein [Pasteurella caecimuris]MCX2960293.1 hypothetical protein [Rodentibacter heylii]